MAACYHCGTAFPAPLNVVRSTECPSCRRDVRVCRNCRHFAPGSHWDCRETVSDPVVDKERANFCDWFSLAEGGGGDGGPERVRKARAGFDALFGG